MTPTVLIVDAHAGFRSFARTFLEAAGMNVIGEAADGSAAVGRDFYIPGFRRYVERPGSCACGWRPETRRSSGLAMRCQMSMSPLPLTGMVPRYSHSNSSLISS